MQLADFKPSIEGQVDTAQYIDFLRNFSEYIDVKPPSLWQNINYMFDFQFGYMYMRYLFWNFVGRQMTLQEGITEMENGSVAFLS